MTLTFLIVLPGIMGILTVYFSPIDSIRKTEYRVLAPWAPVFLLLIITLLFSIEGWACWLMILPIFLLMASLGGLLGGHLKLKKSEKKLSVSLVVLLPFLFGPLESLVDSQPTTFVAYTYIDIKAPADKIWNQVTKVSEISLEEDKGYLTRFLGFPRPVKAELIFEGIGAYRSAIFTNGLVFHETVTEYKENQKMSFTIKANPHEIPSTTLDSHIVIGGEFFDVLNGTYELEAISNNYYRLHLSSQFQMNTTFNFYAGWWGKLIMKDIQNNILQVEKKRAEMNVK
ncbi:hypothetical protein [Algoriphagus jejuensis]